MRGWWECKMPNPLANSLVISYKTQHATTIWPGNCTLGHLAQRNENLCSRKNLCTNVHGGFVSQSPSLGTTQLAFIREMVKQFSHTLEYDSAIKMKELLVYAATCMRLQGNTLSGEVRS